MSFNVNVFPIFSIIIYIKFYFVLCPRAIESSFSSYWLNIYFSSFPRIFMTIIKFTFFQFGDSIFIWKTALIITTKTARNNELKGTCILRQISRSLIQIKGHECETNGLVVLLIYRSCQSTEWAVN